MEFKIRHTEYRSYKNICSHQNYFNFAICLILAQTQRGSAFLGSGQKQRLAEKTSAAIQHHHQQAVRLCLSFATRAQYKAGPEGGDAQVHLHKWLGATQSIQLSKRFPFQINF